MHGWWFPIVFFSWILFLTEKIGILWHDVTKMFEKLVHDAGL